jgi:glycosyltransferase involved in cell wall biosynthesis
MRIAVEATATAPGGGLSLLRHAMPALEAALPTARFDVYVAPTLARERFGVSARTIVAGPFFGWAHRVAWVQSTFATLARGYDAVLAPGNFAPLHRADRTVLFVQNAHVLPGAPWRGEYRRTKRRLQRALARASISRARTVVFISHAMKSWAEPYWRGRQTEPLVAHPGVTLAHVASVREEGPPSVLAVANLVPHKRLDHTVRVVAGVKRALGQPIRLQIAGGDVGDGMAARLDALAVREGLGSGLELLGFVGSAELCRLYARTTCYLTNSALEAWPLPILEALAMGVPVAVPQCEPFTEMCGPSGRYFAPDDEAAAVACVRHIIETAAPDAESSAARRQHASQFSWARFGCVLADGLLMAADAGRRAA